MGSRAAKRLESRHPLECIPAGEVEDHRIPGRGGHVRGVFGQTATPEVRAGVLWWFVHGAGHLVVVEQSLHPAQRHQSVV